MWNSNHILHAPPPTPRAEEYTAKSPTWPTEKRKIDKNRLKHGPEICETNSTNTCSSCPWKAWHQQMYWRRFWRQFSWAGTTVFGVNIEPRLGLAPPWWHQPKKNNALSPPAPTTPSGVCFCLCGPCLNGKFFLRGKNFDTRWSG